MGDYISREAAISESCEDCMGRDWCKSNGKSCSRIKDINAVPAADVVEVVRCRECIYYNKDSWLCENRLGLPFANPNKYCSMGVRRLTDADGN